MLVSRHADDTLDRLVATRSVVLSPAPTAAAPTSRSATAAVRLTSAALALAAATLALAAATFALAAGALGGFLLRRVGLPARAGGVVVGVANVAIAIVSRCIVTPVAVTTSAAATAPASTSATLPTLALALLRRRRRGGLRRHTNDGVLGTQAEEARLTFADDVDVDLIATEIQLIERALDGFVDVSTARFRHSHRYLLYRCRPGRTLAGH